MLTKLKSYFFELDFFYTEKVLGNSLLGKKRNWVLLCYLLLSFGIFARQISHFPIVDLNIDKIKWSVLAASFIFSFAILPILIRWVNRKKRGRPSIEQLLSSFGVGFFADWGSEAITTFFNIFK